MPDTEHADEALFDFLKNHPGHEHIRACVVISSSNEDTVWGPPDLIGSTTVQYGLQSLSAYGIEPKYESAAGVLTVPSGLRIPSVGLGLNVDSDSSKGLQVIMTALLAMSGVQ